MKIGIVQGRLLPPVDGHIQEFSKDWKQEFENLGEVGINHVEWIITKKSFENNSFFTENLAGLPISSVCCDHIIDEKIVDFDFLCETLMPVCNAAERNGKIAIGIPLLEGSNMDSDTKREEFIDSIGIISDLFPELNFFFETELSPKKTLEIIESRPNFFVTYDTGNVTSYLQEHEEYITTLKDKIVNVHLKDRTYQAKTVLPFTGDTDFKLIFKLLKKIGYNGLYTLQIARGESGNEKQHIAEYKKRFEELHAELFV